jgi:hypothetical protein
VEKDVNLLGGVSVFLYINSAIRNPHSELRKTNFIVDDTVLQFLKSGPEALLSGRFRPQTSPLTLTLTLIFLGIRHAQRGAHE